MSDPEVHDGAPNTPLTTTQRLIAAQPSCTYCAGRFASVSRDHAPPLALFDLRDRPKGLEFGACEECHQGTREMDLIMSVFSRLYGESKEAAQLRELRSLMGQFVKRHPHLAFEFENSDEIRAEDGSVVGHRVDIADGYLSDVCNAFSARLGFALFREISGAPVPEAGGVAVRWFSNYEAFTGQLPDDLLRITGPVDTLRAGQKHVFDQFSYSWVETETKETMAFYVTFRKAFALAAFVKTDRSDFPVGVVNRFVPGFLQGWKPPVGRGPHVRKLREIARQAGLNLAPRADRPA